MKHLRKHTISIIALCLVGIMAWAGPYDIRGKQRNDTDSGDWDFLFPTPAANADGILFLPGGTKVPGYLLIGSGLSVTSGTLNASASAFDFSLPASRTLVVSTDYQASNSAKAAIIYPSYACTNATQVLASSACTVQVRMAASAVTCSTGTIYYTQSLAVSLGVLLTQASTNPVPIMLPIGAHFILCPVTGTFTVTTVEQSAG